MQQLVPIVRLELSLILGLLALVVAYKILTGAINMRGLLDGKATGGSNPGSVQSPVLARDERRHNTGA